MSGRLEQLIKLHQLDPKDPFCPYGIALEHAKAGQADEALAWLDKTLELDARYCYAYYQKGKILAENGRDGEARKVLDAGLKAAQQARDSHAASEIEGLMDSLN
ncbi:MAG: hypothetical protein IT441_00080 [Phycisphaeraceae bacterium]|nr:hypothetical protein [Phycisphaeraceae bacterium]